MEFSLLMNYLQEDFFVNLFASYSMTKMLDLGINKVKDKKKTMDIQSQLLQCLENAHREACGYLGWEYEPSVFCEIVETISQKGFNFYAENKLTNILSQAIGQEITDKDVFYWVQQFQIELACEEYTQLREFIKLQILLQKRTVPSLHKRYIEKLTHPKLSHKKITLTLNDLYIENEYRIGNNGERYNDLSRLIDAFLSNNIEEFVSEKGNNVQETINALFVFGHQCTGKSTLVSRIIYNYYFKSQLYNKNLFVVSFSERSFQKNDFTPYEICKYLSVDIDSLNNAIIIIDGLDESDWSSSVMLDKLEHLINDLHEYNCLLIVTSRPNFQYSTNLNHSICIHLQSFSIKQAEQFLQLYETIFPEIDSASILQQLSNSTCEIQEIVLIPYIFFTCITHGIELNCVTELAQLYDIVFFGNNADFLDTPYNSKNRYIDSEKQALQSIINYLSIYYLNSNDNLIPVDVLNDYYNNDNLKVEKMTSEFLLYRKDMNNYTFIHNSIPYYFVARYLYDVFINDCKDIKFDILIEQLSSITRNERIIPTAIFDFWEYFVRKDNYFNSNELISFIKAFLSRKLNKKLSFTGDLPKIEQLYYVLFINIVRCVLSLIKPNVKPFSEYNFFSKLSDEEKKVFITYSNLGNASLDCLNICSFSHLNLNEINLSGINLRGKVISNSSMKNVKFIRADLEGAYCINSDFTLSNFDKANCKNIDFSNSNLSGCSFKNTHLNGSDFSNAKLYDADLREAQLNKCKFNDASLNNAKISVNQLRMIPDFNIDFIRKNKIKVYDNDCLLPDEMLEEEYRRQCPVDFALHYDLKPYINNNN